MHCTFTTLAWYMGQESKDDPLILSSWLVQLYNVCYEYEVIIILPLHDQCKQYTLTKKIKVEVHEYNIYIQKQLHA